jgi:hypothetical protein
MEEPYAHSIKIYHEEERIKSMGKRGHILTASVLIKQKAITTMPMRT